MTELRKVIVGSSKIRVILPFLVGVFSLSTLSLSVVAESVELSFELDADPATVAIQFDVMPTGDSISLGSPVFVGASPHVVESAALGSGAVRHVVYTTTGLPISPTGHVEVTFSANGVLTDGMVTISGVVASDANGEEVSADPGSAPVLISPATGYRSVPVGEQEILSANAVDLDGSVASVAFTAGASNLGSANGPFAEVSWTPQSAGIFAISATVTDGDGGATAFDLGTIRAYLQSEIASYSDFLDIHFGAGADPNVLDVGADPLASTIANGSAYLLGINPHRPDYSQLPKASVEGDDFVFRFSRVGSLGGIDWLVAESESLSIWSEVPSGWVGQTAGDPGFIDVEVRKPLGNSPPDGVFMQLHTESAP